MKRRLQTLDLAKAVLDGIAWTASVVIAVLLRHEFDVAAVSWPATMMLAAIAVFAQLVLGSLLQIYRGRFGDGSIEEVRAVAVTIMIEGVILSLFGIIAGPALGLPRSAAVIAVPVAAVLMFALRYARTVFFSDWRTVAAPAERKAIIYGAGSIGQSLVRSMTSGDAPILAPVAFIDDAPRKRNLRVRGVPVMGTLTDLAAVAMDTGATDLIVAIGRADASLLRRAMDAGTAAGVAVLVLPELDRILAGASDVSDLRNVSIEDLIGRQPVETDLTAIAGYLTGKRVLVTGAGGSIGSELCRQINQFGPAELIMLDRDETGLQQAQLRTTGHGLLNTPEVVLADIRDEAAVSQVFQDRVPEVVFHAAALKHLPMLEQYPDEAWKTNVIGTLHVLKASQSVGVRTFVNISTDKAANPTSVLGHSKRVAEKLTAWAASETSATYLSVRFGNVIGSRGSMLPTFQTLIESGRPVTVTHPEVTRYFMTIPEACQLVVQAGGIGRPGEVLILDMGEPVRILDVARRMIAMSGKRVDIVFTGLREGEKLHEDLVAEDEATSRPFHPKISHARVGSISPDRLDKRGWEARLAPSIRQGDTTTPRTADERTARVG